MPWQTIVETSSVEELESYIPDYGEIPAGTPIKIRLELQWWAPIGKMSDLAGAEFWVPRLAEADVDVTDVYGNWHWIEIVGTARGVAPLIIIAALIAAVAIFGISVYLKSVLITADIEREKLEQADQWLREGYTPEQVTQLLEGARPTKPTLPTPSLPAVAGIGARVAVAVGLIVLLLVVKRKK